MVVCDVLAMFITVTMFCNNVSVLCNHMIVTGYVLIGEIAFNKYPVLLLLLLTNGNTWSTEILVGEGGGIAAW